MKERQRKPPKLYNEHTYYFHGNFLIRLCMFVLPKFPFDAFLLIHFDCDIYIYIYRCMKIYVWFKHVTQKFMGEYTINYLFNVYFYIHIFLLLSLAVDIKWRETKNLLWFNKKTFIVFFLWKKMQLVLNLFLNLNSKLSTEHNDNVISRYIKFHVLCFHRIMLQYTSI